MDNYDFDARIINTAPKDETVTDVLTKMRNDPFLNRGRYAAFVVRLGAATKREKLKNQGRTK